MEEETFRYFTYGSNLLQSQVIDRTGFKKEPVRAKLSGFKFAFNKQGRHNRVYANIVADPNEEVQGAVYEFDKSAFEKMASFEGGYHAVEVIVQLEGGELVRAKTFVADEKAVCEEKQPPPDYLEKIIRGATDCELDKDYTADIEERAKRGGR